MERTDFIRQYAQGGLSDEYAEIGIIEVGRKVMFAMPCACGDEDCQGWAMLTGESVLDHLFFRAPEALRDAYRVAIQARVSP